MIMPAKRRKTQRPTASRKPAGRKPRKPADPATQEPTNQDSFIDELMTRYGLTVPFPRGHPSRPTAAYEAIMVHLGIWQPYRPARKIALIPIDVADYGPSGPWKRPTQQKRKPSARLKTERKKR